MARIKIKDLNPKMKISKDEMKKVLGGFSFLRARKDIKRIKTVRFSGAREWIRK